MVRAARLVRMTTVAALLTAAAVTMSGCAGLAATDTGRQSLTAPASAGQLHIRTANGSVEVRRADVAVIEIEATVRAIGQERVEQTRIVAEPAADGGTRVYVVWPDGQRRSNEGCSFVIRTPDADGVDIDTSNGRVTIVGLRGPARVDTSNGAIEVEDHTGGVFADTSNGRITLRKVQGDVVADSSNGAIEALDVAGKIQADTSNGRVSVRLAPGCHGPLDLDTSNGAVRVEVAAGFAGVFDARTSNGAVRVLGASSVDGGRASAKATFGAGGEESVIRTSNGSVEIVSAAVER